MKCLLCGKRVDGSTSSMRKKYCFQCLKGKLKPSVTQKEPKKRK